MQLTVAFTHSVPVTVFIDGAQYQVVSSAVGPPVGGGNIVYLQNLDDGRTGHVFNATGTSATQLFSIPELPPGRMMAYGMGRLWQSLPNGISFIAGDIVGGPSGSPTYNFRDAVLKVSENALLSQGGFFSVPSNLGIISAMQFTSQLDASLGQGPLMVVTPGGVFSCNAPVDRTTWQSLTNPILSESLIGLGGLGQNSTLVANGDMLFRAVDGIRSLIMARRDFWSWGNAPISFEMNRVINADNANGLPFGSAVQFDNRMLMTCQPALASTGGWINSGLIALNFDPVSSLQGKGASVYDGLWTGINVLQIIEGQFNGVHRCFAFTYNTDSNQIEIVELLTTGTLDNGTTPITWQFEAPVLFRDVKGKAYYDLISLEDGEFYVSDLTPGQTVNFVVEYRPDFSNQWYPWHSFSLTQPPNAPFPGYGARLGLGKADGVGTGNGTVNSNFGRWIQTRWTITGHCVWKGSKVSGSMQPQTQFARVISAT